MCCGKPVCCSLQHVVLAECIWGTAIAASYLGDVVQALRRIDTLVPQRQIGLATPLGEWCKCRTVVRTAIVAVERRIRGETVNEDGWVAVRKVMAGLLPECRAISEMEAQDRQRAEVAVAKAIVELQAVVISMLHMYRERTRRVRAQKREQLDAWWVEHRRRRGLHAKVLKGL